MATYTAPGVYVEEVPAGPAGLSPGATAVAAFVGFTAKSPAKTDDDPEGLKPRLVTNWSQFESLYGGFTEGAMLPLAVYGYFNNGGQLAYIVRIPHTEPAKDPAKLSLLATDRALGEALEVTTKGPATGEDVSIVLDSGPAPEGDADGPSTFNLRVLADGAEVESYEGLTFGAGDKNVEKVVNAESKKVQVAVKLDAATKLEDIVGDVVKSGSYALAKPAPLPVPVKPKAFAGSDTARTGINGLVIADDVTMVAVPDLVTAAKGTDGKVDLKMWKSVQLALINHCEGQGNRLAILDSPPGMNAQEIKEWRSDEAMYDSAFAAMYYPWIKVANPIATNGDSELLMPPSGHVAGIWARNDDTRGVWKAPANEVVRGALNVELPITQAEQGLLNPIGINCIRPFGTRGIRVWGGRTLGSDEEWKYLNVRRLFNMVEDTILKGTQWVVFEPNDFSLWQKVKRQINSFLRDLWRSGALFGATADQAFYVKCDEETNPPESIDAGKLVVEIGIAPVKPAEFVIFRISQYRNTAGA
ncbi:MAG: phage tail sheath family protein [Acidimicrobiales bacterium]